MTDVNKVLYDAQNLPNMRVPKALSSSPVLTSAAGQPIIRSQPVWGPVHTNTMSTTDYFTKDYSFHIHYVPEGNAYNGNITVPVQMISPCSFGIWTELSADATWTLPSATDLITFITNKFGPPTIDSAWEIDFRNSTHSGGQARITWDWGAGGSGGRGRNVPMTCGKIKFIIKNTTPGSYSYQAWIFGN